MEFADFSANARQPLSEQWKLSNMKCKAKMTAVQLQRKMCPFLIWFGSAVMQNINFYNVLQ